MKWIRTTLAVIVGVIALVCLLCSVIGFWARNTVLDETKVASAVETALDDPAVTDALAVRLTDSVVNAVDLDGFVEKVLPPALQPLRPAIVGGATQLVEERLSARLGDAEIRERLVNIFERSYAEFLDVLKGDGLADGVTVVDGKVTVNFLPVIADGAQQLQRLGLANDVTVPELTRDGEPQEQIAQLEQAFNRDLPDDFGQIVVYQSDSLAEKGETLQRVQQLVIVIQRAFIVLLIVTVVALVGAVLLAHRRLRAIAILLVSAAALFVVSRVVVNKVLDDIPSVAKKPAGQAALAAATQELAQGLLGAFGAGAVLFVVAAAVVYMLDPNSAMRRRVAERTGSSSLAVAIGANRVAVALGSFVAALLVLTLAGIHVLSLIFVGALVALGLFALAQHGRSESPPPEVPSEPPAAPPTSDPATPEPAAP